MDLKWKANGLWDPTSKAQVYSMPAPDTALGEATVVLETLFMTPPPKPWEVPGQLCLNLSLPLILGAPEGL